MSSGPVLGIVLVEDHSLVRAAVRQALDAAPILEVVGEAETAEEALNLIPRLLPDVALIDIDRACVASNSFARLAPRLPDMWSVMLTISRPSVT